MEVRKQIQVGLLGGQRELLRQASSGLSGQEWDKLPPAEKREYMTKLNKVIDWLVEINPYAFGVSTIKQHFGRTRTEAIDRNREEKEEKDND